MKSSAISFIAYEGSSILFTNHNTAIDTFLKSLSTTILKTLEIIFNSKSIRESIRLFSNIIEILSVFMLG